MAMLKDIPLPSDYTWLFSHFLMIWQNCEYDLSGTKVFHFRDITDYEKVFGVSFTYHERRMIVKMKNWAFEIIAEFQKED